jgi:hypothetical protein
MTEKQLRATYPTHVRAVKIARGALRRIRQFEIDAAAQAHVERLKAESEAFRRHRADHERVHREVHTEYTVARRRAAAVAIYPLRAVQQHVEEWRSWVAEVQRDTARTFPNVLNHVDANGMLSLAILRTLRAPQLQRASAADLRAAYRGAIDRNDASSLVDCGIIEDIVHRNAYHAADASELSIAKSLREYISDIEALRLPDDVPDFEALDADVTSLWTRASAAQIIVADPQQDPEAARAFTAQKADLLEAGLASDRDDIAVVQKSMAAAKATA